MTRARLFVPDPLAAGASLELTDARAHYLVHVLRLKPGAGLSVFNAEHGQWCAELATVGRHRAELAVLSLERAPVAEPGPILCMAPIRQNRLDWLVEKAAELGVAGFEPVLTEHTVVKLGRTDRLQAIAVEAAEQCDRLVVPAIRPPMALDAWLAERGPGERIVFADEAGGGRPIAAVPTRPTTRLLIGPEGGFAPRERLAILAHPAVVPVSLGPRLLRAETAALFAISVLQALTMASDDTDA